LDHIPVVIWEPVLDWIGFTSLGDTTEKEVHIFLLKFDLDDFFLHETEGDQGQENELMGDEESSGDPLEDNVSDLLSEGKDSFLTLYSGLVHGFEEEVLERLKGELIHMRQDAQCDTQEIQHGSFSGDWSIDLSLDGDNFLSLGSLYLLLFNFVRSSLGLIKLLNQWSVLENGLRNSLLKGIQKLLFESGELHLIIVLIFDELLSLLLELSFFLVDDVSQELLLETLLCDDEVDNSTLGGNLWWIIWVEHFGLEIKLELK
jgi:hypothetical protein